MDSIQRSLVPVGGTNAVFHEQGRQGHHPARVQNPRSAQVSAGYWQYTPRGAGEIHGRRAIDDCISDLDVLPCTDHHALVIWLPGVVLVGCCLSAGSEDEALRGRPSYLCSGVCHDPGCVVRVVPPSGLSFFTNLLWRISWSARLTKETQANDHKPLRSAAPWNRVSLRSGRRQSCSRNLGANGQVYKYSMPENAPRIAFFPPGMLCARWWKSRD